MGSRPLGLFMGLYWAVRMAPGRLQDTKWPFSVDIGSATGAPPWTWIQTRRTPLAPLWPDHMQPFHFQSCSVGAVCQNVPLYAKTAANVHFVLTCLIQFLSCRLVNSVIFSVALQDSMSQQHSNNHWKTVGKPWKKNTKWSVRVRLCT